MTRHITGGAGGPAEGGGRRTRPAAVDAHGYGWRHAGRRAWALRALDLQVEPGERVLLLGSSGSGKSTLLAALAGVLGVAEEGESTGVLTVNGGEPSAVRGSVGLVLQDPDSQVIASRVGDDIAFGCENLGVPREQIWRRVHEALTTVGLAASGIGVDRPTAALSGGQKQRLALAGVLAMRPGLLLLDEPTANLDPTGVVEVRDAVRRSLDATGSTLVVVEHRVAVWRDVVDRVIVLDAASGLLADGTPNEILDQNGSRAPGLRAAGVWLPGDDIVRYPAPGAGAALVTTEALALTREHRLRRRAARSGASSQTIAVDIELKVRRAGAVAITGPNGSGKSTLALTLGGLLEPASGRVIAEGDWAARVGPDPAAWSSTELLTRIGTVFQNPEHQFLATTVRAELAIGPRALGLPPAEIEARIELLLERLGLSALAAANPFTLSGGQKRRLSVGTALATRPRMVILDEPTFGQDASTWREIIALLAGLRDEGTAVVVVTHDTDVVDALDARELRLDRGVLSEVGRGVAT